MTLTDFLLARIAEDETRSRYDGWHTVDCGVGLGYWANDECICGYFLRVLAECEAKRLIVGLHGPDEYWVEEVQEEVQDIGRDAQCKLCGCGDCWPVDYPCATLRLLALPYADHADYREEWKP